MAIYHLSAKPVQRSKGRSVTSAIAYRAACVIEDKRTGLKYDYTKKKGVIHSEIIVPHGIRRPERNELWNWAELTERRKDACTGREYEVNLPYELTDEQRIVLCQDFSKYLCQTHGIAVDFSIHKPTEKDIKEGADPRNYHAHIMTTTRKINDEGLTDKADIEKAGRKRKKDLEATRKAWADFANKHLQMAGFRERIDHRSLIDQGSNRKPTIKMGWESTTAERNGIRTIKGDINRQIKDDNRKISKLSKELPRLNIQRSGEILDEQIANYKRQQQHEKQLELERLEREKQAQLERQERQKQLEMERLEREKQAQLERERQEQHEKQLELERLEREKQAQLERERQERHEKQLELERLEREKQAQLERERQERHEKQLELERLEREKQAQLERERQERQKQLSIRLLENNLRQAKNHTYGDFEANNIAFYEFLKHHEPLTSEQVNSRFKTETTKLDVTQTLSFFSNGLMSVNRYQRGLEKGSLKCERKYFETSDIVNIDTRYDTLELKNVGISLKIDSWNMHSISRSVKKSEQYKLQLLLPKQQAEVNLEQNEQIQINKSSYRPRF